MTATATTAQRGRAFLLTVTAVAALGGFLFGFDTGVVSGALLYIRHDFSGLSSLQQGAVVSRTLLATIGALAGGVAADRVGRRRTILAVALAFVAGILIIVVAQSLGVLIVGRFVSAWALEARPCRCPSTSPSSHRPGFGARWSRRTSSWSRRASSARTSSTMHSRRRALGAGCSA